MRKLFVFIFISNVNGLDFAFNMFVNVGVAKVNFRIRVHKVGLKHFSFIKADK